MSDCQIFSILAREVGGSHQKSLTSPPLPIFSIPIGSANHGSCNLTHALNRTAAAAAMRLWTTLITPPSIMSLYSIEPTVSLSWPSGITSIISVFHHHFRPLDHALQLERMSDWNITDHGQMRPHLHCEIVMIAQIVGRRSWWSPAFQFRPSNMQSGYATSLQLYFQRRGWLAVVPVWLTVLPISSTIQSFLLSYQSFGQSEIRS